MIDMITWFVGNTTGNPELRLTLDKRGSQAFVNETRGSEFVG